MSKLIERSRRVAGLVPPKARGIARAVVYHPTVRRVVIRPRWGNMRRLQPFSSRYGFDRGTPIDRYYLDLFFRKHAACIRGRVLEVCNPEFSERFGRFIDTLDLVDIDPRNDAATILADLAQAGSLPQEAFDCVILPQTLQYVEDVATALTNVWQSVAPGGTLLLSVPGISKIDHHLEESDRWRILPAGLVRAVATRCPSAESEIESFGNVLTATAFLLGLAVEELRAEELAAHDPLFPVVSCARVRKGPG